MDNLKITRLSMLDINWMACMHRQAFEPSWHIEGFEDLLHLPKTIGWHASQNMAPAEPLGFILFQAERTEAEILTFVVDQSHQGVGVGGSLLNQSLRALKLLGLDSVYLEVATSRRAARKLYESQGFVIAGQRKNYYRTPYGREDALIMHLSLSS